MKIKDRDTKKVQKKKKQITKQLFEFIYSFRIILETEIIDLSKFTQCFVILFSMIQETSLLVEMYETKSNSSDGLMNCFFILKNFTRPYQVFDETFYKYSYLITLSIYILQYLLHGYLFIQFKREKNKQQNKINLFYSQPRIFIFLMSFLTYCSSLQYHMLFIPYLETTVNSIIYNAQDVNLNIGNIIFGIISLLLVLENMISHMMCNFETINLKFKSLGILKQTFSFYWKQITLILIILIHKLNASQQTKFNLIFSFMTFQILLNFQSYFFFYVSIYKRTLIDLMSITLQFSILTILIILNQADQQIFDSSLLIIICPILPSLIQSVYKQFHEYKMMKHHLQSSPAELQYKIANIIQKYGKNKRQFQNKGYHIVMKEYFKGTHQSQCEQLTCLCRIPHLQLTFSQVVQLYLKDTIKLFATAINTIKTNSEKQDYFLHYLLFINYLGLKTAAYQLSNLKVYQDSEVNSLNKMSIQQSECKPESSNSLDQKSYSIQRSKNFKDNDSIARVKTSNMNFIQQIKLKLLQDVIRQSMSNSLKQTTNQEMSENLAHAVTLFLISEEENKRLKLKLVKQLQQKRQFFNDILLNSGQLQLFQEAKQLLIKMKKVEYELEKLYDKFPSHKMQALNTFFQSEIMNNYFSAYKLATVASISDEKLLKMQSQITFDLFSNKIDYLIMGFDQESHHLQIRQTSNMIHQFFGLSLEQFKMLNAVDPLLPSGFQTIHQRLVSNFLQTGESKFFRSINLGFCRISHKCMKPIDLFFDISLANLDDLTFVSFLQDTQVSSAFILCTQNSNKIECVTDSLSKKLGYSPNLNKALVDSFLKLSANRIFPKLNQFYESFLTKSIQNPQSTVDGIQDNYDKSENQILICVPDPDVLFRQDKFNWNQSDNQINLEVDAVFHVKNAKQEFNQYLIIEIREAKRYLKTTEMSTPFQTIPLNSTNNNLDLLEDIIDIDDQQLFEEEQEFCINTPKAMEFYDDALDIQDKFGSRVRIKNQHQSQYCHQPNISIALVSPKDSVVRLIDDKNEISQQLTGNVTMKKDNKQKYFSAIEQREEPDSSDQMSSQQQQIQGNNQIDQQLQNDDIDRELQENIKMQLQMEQQRQNFIAIVDVGSEPSSLAGIKKSKYWKKYDLLYKVVNSDKFSHNFITMKYFLSLMFFTFMVFASIEVSYSKDDLLQFLAEISLLQIKANIIGPIDNYIVGQNSVINYAILAQQNIITYEQAYQQSRYSNREINFTYYELKTSFETQLQNKYLDPFFKDRYMQIQMGAYPELDTHNITVREAIQLELEAALNFAQMDYFDFVNIDPSSNFFVYLLKNYPIFQSLFQQLNTDMLEYSVNRANQVSQKWYYLLVPMIVIGAVLVICGIYYYKLYLKQYDEFLQLFQFIDNVWLQRDVDRYRGITNLLMKDSDVLFKYKFDLESKEKFLATEQVRKEKIAQGQKSQKDKLKTQSQYVGMTQTMSQLPSLLTLILLYGVCFIFCFISNSLAQNYFIKYPNTCRFFNLLSDISIASSGVFSTKEISYTIQSDVSFFYFYNDKNATAYIDVFFHHIDVINEFLDQVTRIDFSNFISSNQFQIDFDKVMSEDACSFLPDYKIQWAQQHCDSAEDGVMRQGMIQTLNKVKNTLLTEYETSNQFKNETIQIKQDLEIGLMTYDDLNDLRDLFQAQLTDFTNQLNQQLTIINSCFIVLIIISTFLVYTVIESYFKWEFSLVKHFVTLLPQTSLFIDSILDRNLRQLIVKDELI